MTTSVSMSVAAMVATMVTAPMSTTHVEMHPIVVIVVVVVVISIGKGYGDETAHEEECQKELLVHSLKGSRRRLVVRIHLATTYSMAACSNQSSRTHLAVFSKRTDGCIKFLLVTKSLSQSRDPIDPYISHRTTFGEVA